MKRNLWTGLAMSLALASGMWGAAASAQGNFRLEGMGSRREALNAMQNKPAPELEVARWINGKPLKLSELRGKVVLLDFWGQWCGPCVASIPHNNELVKKWAGKGLVIVAVHTPFSAEKVDDFVKQKGIDYAVALDATADGENGKTATRYQVDSYPDYYLIDRKGNLRYADLANDQVDRALEALLAEK